MMDVILAVLAILGVLLAAYIEHQDLILGVI